MNSWAQKILDHKRTVLILFIIAIVLSAILQRIVSVNYDLISYLPSDSHSTISMDVMKKEFASSPPNARVMIKDVNLVGAISYKERLASVPGVLEINWLDDSQNIYQPLEAIPQRSLESWYKDGNALFTLVIDDNLSSTAIAEIKEIIQNKGELTGDIVEKVSALQNTGSEVNKMLLFILPLIILILILTTSSWFEPLLFMLAIVVAIVINNGTNAFLGEISFITKTTSAILQLAVSMDYSIFLLHRFSEFRSQGQDVKTAMVNAMKKSFSSISASGMTTAIGFGALIIMRFRIGPDLGIVLAKGILFSMLSILLLLPVVTVYTYKLIDRTHHRSFLPSFEKFGKFAVKIGVPIIILVAILVVPAFLAQQNNDFMYGPSVMGSKPGAVKETDEIFGKANTMVLLVPKGDIIKERTLADELAEKPYMSDIISYTKTVGTTIPKEFVPENRLSQLESENFSRMVLTLSTTQESPEAFDAVEEIRRISESYYPQAFYLAGGTANIYDIRTTVIQDNQLVTIIAIVGIGLILLLTFRSLTLPLVLLITIEASIWVNLSFPYFMDEKTAYLGFMIISAIQLGATVDYAILFANRYLENRGQLSKRKAAVRTVADTAASILTSAGILVISGFIMGAVSTNGVVGQLGNLIGRGTLLSASMVFFFLPTALMILDKPIQKTTLGIKFHKGE